MILDLLKSAAAGMLLHACIALVPGTHSAGATAAPLMESAPSAPQACLLPAAAATAQASSLALDTESGNRP